MENNKFEIGMAIPPGSTLKEVLDDRNITQKELALRLGVTPKHINKIINGAASISHELALKLESVLSISASFWNKLEMNYQETKARLKEIPQIDEELYIIDKIPYKEAANFGWLPVTNDKREQVRNLRSFFRISSLDNLKFVEDTLFRKCQYYATNEYSLALWMNYAEKLALDIETESFNLKNLKNVLPKIRELTKRPLKASKVDLQEICESVGIAVVFIPTLSGTHVNGATKWLSNKKVMIALTSKGIYEDIFWFTFFHEIGHVFQENKDIIFVDEDENKEQTDLETDADNFSTNILIPNSQYDIFITKNNYTNIAEIRGFADKIDVHIGIVIGRLLHDNRLSYNSVEYKSYEKLRRKYRI